MSTERVDWYLISVDGVDLNARNPRVSASSFRLNSSQSNNEFQHSAANCWIFLGEPKLESYEEAMKLALQLTPLLSTEQCTNEYERSTSSLTWPLGQSMVSPLPCLRVPRAPHRVQQHHQLRIYSSRRIYYAIQSFRLKAPIPQAALQDWSCSMFNGEPLILAQLNLYHQLQSHVKILTIFINY